MSKYAQGKYQVINTAKYVGNRLPTYRSSWEFTFCTFCDNNISVLQWASESITIPYHNPVLGKQTIYVPDFLIVYVDANQKQHTELIEIKPAKEASMSAAKSLRDKYVVAVNMAKWAAADAFCRANGLKFRVVTEHDLYSNMKR